MSAAPLPVVLTIDQGTTAVKVAIVDAAGRVRDREEGATAIRRGHGTVVADPRDWWTQILAVLGRLHRRQDLSGVGAIAVSGFMHTLVPLGGRPGLIPPRGVVPPVGDILLPGDVRAVEAEEEFADVPAASARSALARIAVWARDDKNPIHALVTVKDFIRYRLTGRVASDLYDASGCGLFDPATGDPRAAALRLLDRLGVPAPELCAPAEAAGFVSDAVAAQTGLVPGTPVVTGSGDWLATCLGAQATLPDRPCLYLGTSAVYGGFADAGALAALAPPRCLSVTIGSGRALAWAAQAFARPAGTIGALLDAASRSTAGARGVRYLPSAAASAEGSGQLTGLTEESGPDDLARAAVDGIAEWIGSGIADHRLVPAGGRVLLCGGGARDPRWIQTLASTLGVPVAVSAERDVASLGLARLAFAGLGDDVDWAPPAAEVLAGSPWT